MPLLMRTVDRCPLIVDRALHLKFRASGLAPHRDAGSTHTGGVLVNSRWFASVSERTTGTRHAQTRTPAGVPARMSIRHRRLSRRTSGARVYGAWYPVVRSRALANHRLFTSTPPVCRKHLSWRSKHLRLVRQTLGAKHVDRGFCAAPTAGLDQRSTTNDQRKPK